MFIIKECLECPARFKVKRGSRQHLCPACKGKKIDMINKQIRNKRGAYYRKWKANLSSALHEE